MTDARDPSKLDVPNEPPVESACYQQDLSRIVAIRAELPEDRVLESIDPDRQARIDELRRSERRISLTLTVLAWLGRLAATTAVVSAALFFLGGRTGTRFVALDTELAALAGAVVLGIAAIIVFGRSFTIGAGLMVGLALCASLFFASWWWMVAVAPYVAGTVAAWRRHAIADELERVLATLLQDAYALRKEHETTPELSPDDYVDGPPTD